MERGWIPPIHARVGAELQFGLVESALRDCFLRHGGANQEIYVRELTRCLRAYLERADRYR